MLLIVCALTGCGADKTLYREMETLQKQAAALTSGTVTMTVQFEEDGVPGEYAAALTFCKTADGSFAYCQKQFDLNEQVVFCEYSDGKRTRQWMIGRGWEELGGAQFTEEKPHRYLAMMTTPYARKLIRHIEKETDESGTRYVLSMDAGRVTKAQYADGVFEVSAQTATITFDTEGLLTGYSEDTTLKHRETGVENAYHAELLLKEHDAVKTVEEPKLREYAGFAK